MDNYREEIVVRKKGAVIYKIAYVLAWIFLVFFAFAAAMNLAALMNASFNGGVLLLFILCGGAALALYFYKDNLLSEYEYTFTNGEIDFDMVLGNRRRKRLLSLRVRQMEAGGRVSGSQFEKYYSMPDVKKINYYLNDSDSLYFLYFIRDGKKCLLVFEPSDQIVDMMMQYSKVLEK